MYKLKEVTFLLFLIVFVDLLSAQATLTGSIIDQDSGERLIGVNVILNESSGTITDIDGNYSIKLDRGEQQLEFTYTGYQPQTVSIISDGKTDQTLDIELSTTNSVLDIVVVSGSRFERKLTEETVTIEVITPKILDRNNNTDLSEAVKRIPGVEVVDGQANIRSGSGYAYGAGSRVAILIDDQPLLAAELGDIKWNFIPLENAGQIEVIKGASSVLYGSSALNGVIHVKSAWPTAKPYTAITTYAGISDNPRTDSIIWWSGIQEQPFQVGTSIAHRQKLNDNIDLVVGSNAHYNRSYLKGAGEMRFRLNLNTRVRATDKITYGLNTTTMYHETGNYFLWLNGGDSALIHINPSYQTDDYLSIAIDPWASIYDISGNKHTIKGRYFDILKYRGMYSPNSRATVGSLEYQFQREFNNGWSVSMGGMGQTLSVTSSLFEADTIGMFTPFLGSGVALYNQMEKRLFDKLTVLGGIRWESFYIGGKLTATLPVLRSGFNYKLSERLFLRGSFGQGYRVPSFAERFTDESLGTGVRVLPNPDLQPEKGWSGELGLKQSVNHPRWKGYIDLAAFWMQYENMTEFYFDFHKPDTVAVTLETLQQYLGFKSVNISEARIAGIELGTFGEGKIGNTPLRLWGGYTYSFPGDLNADSTQRNVGIYLENFIKGFGTIDTTLSKKILKYRSLHTARVDAEIDIDNLTLGADFTYNSFVHNVDPILDGTDPYSSLVNTQAPGIADVATFRNLHRTGDFVLGARVAYRIKKKHRVEFAVTNLMNREYFLRAGKLAPPRAFNLRYRVKF